MQKVKGLTMRNVHYCIAILLLAGVGVRADQQTTEAGKQIITARRTTKPVVIDGVFSPGEWSAAIPVHVDAIQPAAAPGLVPWQGQPNAFYPPKNQDDLSYTIYTMYDDNNLYIAVEVADDIIIADNPEVPFLDDVVEIYINGDNQPYDLLAVRDVPDWFGVLPNNEGFQLDTSVGNIRAVYPSPLVQVDWDSHAALRPRGYLVEARISLDSINTTDNSWFTDPALMQPDSNDPTQPAVPGATFNPVFRRPQPGDTIGFNITVGDDDCGRQPGSDNLWEDSWSRTDLVPNPSSYLAWDGSSLNWDYSDESAWGKLYLAP
jgi:hypothetical protein